MSGLLQKEYIILRFQSKSSLGESMPNIDITPCSNSSLNISIHEKIAKHVLANKIKPRSPTLLHNMCNVNSAKIGIRRAAHAWHPLERKNPIT